MPHALAELSLPAFESFESVCYAPFTALLPALSSVDLLGIELHSRGVCVEQLCVEAFNLLELMALSAAVEFEGIMAFTTSHLSPSQWERSHNYEFMYHFLGIH